MTRTTAMTRLAILLLVAAALLEGSGFASEGAAPASGVLVYFGTYTRGPSRGIYRARMHPVTGEVRSLALAAEMDQPSFLAIHPDGKRLYAIGESGRFGGKPGGPVAAFAIDPATGDLRPLGARSSRGAGPCHVSIDASGRVALVANYGGGSVASLPILEDGRLGEAVSFIQHRGSGPDPRRQRGPHAHSIQADPSGRYALAADLGLDRLLVYRLDAEGASLAPADPPAEALAPGSGPRHFAFHPDGRHVYAIQELSSTVTLLGWDAEGGRLERRQQVSTLPDGWKGENSTAEIRVHPSGRFVYGSNRGHDSIAIFRVDAASRELTRVGTESTRGRTPRNFGIDPGGRFLLAANQQSDTVVIFRIDGDDGRLYPTGQELRVPSPVCVRFLAAR